VPRGLGDVMGDELNDGTITPAGRFQRMEDSLGRIEQHLQKQDNRLLAIENRLSNQDARTDERWAWLSRGRTGVLFTLTVAAAMSSLIGWAAAHL